MTAVSQQPISGVSRFFTRVLLTLLAINFATIAALIYIADSFSTEALSKHAEDDITQQVNFLAAKFDEQYRMALNRSLHNLINTPLLDDYLLGLQAERLVLARRLERLFLQLQKDYPAYHAISFVDSNGQVEVNVRERRREAPRMLLINDEQQPGWSNAATLFEQLKKTPLLLSSGNMEWFIPPREPQVLGPFLTGNGIPALVAGLGKLDIDTGLFGGAIMIQLNLERWMEELRRIRFFGVDPVWVMDMNGNVLLRPKDPKVTFDPRPHLPESTGSKTHLLKTGNGLVVYHDLLVEADKPLLRIAIGLPSNLLLHGISHAVDFFSLVIDFYLLVVVASVVLLVLLSYVIARFLARPVLDLAIARNQLANAQRIARLGHWEWNNEQNRVHFSDNALTILGDTSNARELDFKAFLKLVHPNDRAAFMQVLDNARLRGTPGSIEHRLCVKGGENQFIHHEIDIIAGNRHQIVGTIQDISDRRRADAQIRQLAYFDSVTGLANRTLLNELAERALKTAAKEGTRVGVMFLDLDHFKHINDTWGHEAGDELLRQVAKRLMHSVRPSDTVTSAPDILITNKAVARLGGDEFIVLLPKLHHQDDVMPIAARIQATLTRPFSIAGKEIPVSGSLGISIFPNHGHTMDDLLKHADAAMYQAKAKGRNRFELYTSTMEQKIRQRVSIEMQLHRAIDNEDFVLYYQPRIDMRSGEVIAVEALIRWVDPEQKIISPECFIGIAEETGLIIPIGSWVLRTACAQLRAWHLAGAPGLKVSVNLSPIQFTAPDLIGSITKTLDDTGVDARFVELELTENALFDNIDTGARLAHDLKAYGLKLSIDDFGTGYSSLRLLKRLPVDTLKIDQSFIQNILVDKEDALIVKSTVALGRGLGVRVVAEGVEHHEQFTLLQQLGCDEVQGYLLGRPAPAQEIKTQLIANAKIAMTY
ncbi:MAG: EAL domain-containing protein [Gammaproteobacteria bacterium]|nr:EAL domain-containing protein [Gammaproteobacteria bacterium]